MTDPVHPLRRMARERPRQESTAAAPDVVDALGRLRAAIGQHIGAEVTHTVTAAEKIRLASLLEGAAQVLRVDAGTMQHRAVIPGDHAGEQQP